MSKSDEIQRLHRQFHEASEANKIKIRAEIIQHLRDATGALDPGELEQWENSAIHRCEDCETTKHLVNHIVAQGLFRVPKKARTKSLVRRLCKSCSRKRHALEKRLLTRFIIQIADAGFGGLAEMDADKQ